MDLRQPREFTEVLFAELQPVIANKRIASKMKLIAGGDVERYEYRAFHEIPSEL